MTELQKEKCPVIPLRDIEAFKRFTVKFATVTWGDEADLAPEYLYDISIAA